MRSDGARQCAAAAYNAIFCGRTESEKHMQVAAFQCVQPFFGTLLAFLVLGEEPSLWDLGAVGVIGGLALVSLDKSPAIMPSGSPDKQPGLSVRLWRGLRSGTLLRQNSSSPGPKR